MPCCTVKIIQRELGHLLLLLPYQAYNLAQPRPPGVTGSNKDRDEHSEYEDDVGSSICSGMIVF